MLQTKALCSLTTFLRTTFLRTTFLRTTFLRTTLVGYLRVPLLLMPLLLMSLLLVSTKSAAAEIARQHQPDYEACARLGLDADACAGRLIWFKATAGNSRFHTYVFPQRIGALIDWYRVLRTDERDDRFAAWGAINDPDCCVPGSEGCAAKSTDETFGFDYCPGDEELLQYVGKQGYRDPACDFNDAPFDSNDPHSGTKEKKDQRQSACDLEFGTSTGVLGIRKFPNPRFDLAAWVKLNGRAGTWSGFNARYQPKPDDPVASRLTDGSVEPPFLIGTSCGSCHIAFDPAHPPKDPKHPQWDNILGLVGNQYTRISEIMVSGMSPNSLEWQMFAHARPGTSDTSAIPNDTVNNPGTINAIVNIAQRPTFANEKVIKWRKTQSCPAGANGRECWCEPNRDGKCWQRGEALETVHHILKGGEDSIGAQEAIQRVYFNIGSCSEQCWVNHLTDLRQLDPKARQFGQTPFDIGQCRRDCTNFRAIEDRLPNILAFFLSPEGHAIELRAAREAQVKAKKPDATYDKAALVKDLNAEFGANAVAHGADVFQLNCARCHSSEPGGAVTVAHDFDAIDAKTGLRKNFMGNDQATPVSEVGTFRCRSLHSNHMKGHIWEEYGSETLRDRPLDPKVPEVAGAKLPDGRTYYRNITLLNAWAYAPFMHNNAIGPEVCGKPKNPDNDFYAKRARYVGADDRPLPQQPPCVEYDPTVEGRYSLYKASMQQLLNPEARGRKVTVLNDDVVIRVGPRLWDGDGSDHVLGMQVTIPREIDGRALTAGRVGSFQYKSLVADVVRAQTESAALASDLNQRYGEGRGKSLLADLKSIGDALKTNPSGLTQEIIKRPYLAKEVYTSCQEDVENEGHLFGTDLSPADKNALIAFIATL